jgi:hypothetical protein
MVASGDEIVTECNTNGIAGRSPAAVFTAPMASTTAKPLHTTPNTTCCDVVLVLNQSSFRLSPKFTKNCEPAESCDPEFAIATVYLVFELYALNSSRIFPAAERLMRAEPSNVANSEPPGGPPACLPRFRVAA